MVKDVILSRPLRPELACVPSPQRRIAAGPLYAVDDVLEALAAQTLRVVTRKAMRDVQALSLDDEELAQLIRRAVQYGRYKNSEWCETGRTHAAISWAACDAYTVSRDEWNETAGKSFPCEYYLKFAIGKTGLVLLVVSCHL